MTQAISVQKSASQPTENLWWKPLFSLQREMNQAMKDAFSNTGPSAFMAPALWDVEEDLFATMQRNTHRIFSELFNNRQLAAPLLTGAVPEPFINIIENGNNFKIKADVPGLSADDLEVSIADSAITITGSRCEDQLDKGDSYLRQECHCGEFSRTIALPEEADLNKASASFDHNVLTVEIPKKPEAVKKVHRLRIQPAGETKSSSKSESEAKEPDKAVMNS